MKSSSITFPLVLIAVGIIWFLHSTGLLPASNIIISSAMVITGLVIFIVDGINKSSVFNAPLIIYCGIAIYVKSNYQVPLSSILALGLVLIGLLLLLLRTSLIPPKQNNKFSSQTHNQNSQNHG